MNLRIYKLVLYVVIATCEKLTVIAKRGKGKGKGSYDVSISIHQ